jgi:hypothetical protein
MRTYDFHRGLVTALAAGVAGFLVWLATQVGQQTTGRFWASMGIVAGAGLVLAVSQLLGGWTKWGWPRLSMGVLLLGFLPVLVCTGWILLATQPGNGWQEGRLVSWSHSIGIYGIVKAIGLYHGALALAFGLVLGYTLDTSGPARHEDVVVDRTAVATPVATPVMDRPVADEPVAAERDEVAAHRGDALVGVRRGAPDTAAREVEIREGGKPVVPKEPDPLDGPAGMD